MTTAKSSFYVFSDKLTCSGLKPDFSRIKNIQQVNDYNFKKQRLPEDFRFDGPLLLGSPKPPEKSYDMAGGTAGAIAGGVAENHRLNIHDEEIQACRAKVTAGVVSVDHAELPPVNLYYRSNMKRRGFNLIETAIVLGVVGLVIGGIWVAASAVMDNTRRNEIATTIHSLRQRVIEVWHGLPMTEDIPGGGYLRMTSALYPSEEIVARSAIADPIKSYWNTLTGITTYLHKSASGLYSSADTSPASDIIVYSFGPVSRADCVWVGMNITKLITLTDGGFGSLLDANLSIVNSSGGTSFYFQTDGYHIGSPMNSYVKTNCADGINVMSIRMGIPH